jgi:hypothetical protein
VLFQLVTRKHLFLDEELDDRPQQLLGFMQAQAGNGGANNG